jgi:hypothetical protein
LSRYCKAPCPICGAEEAGAAHIRNEHGPDDAGLRDRRPVATDGGEPE